MVLNFNVSLCRRDDAPELLNLDVPQQTNGFDCGIYTVLFADCVANLYSQTLSFDVVSLAENIRQRVNENEAAEYRRSMYDLICTLISNV